MKTFLKSENMTLHSKRLIMFGHIFVLKVAFFPSRRSHLKPLGGSTSLRKFSDDCGLAAVVQSSPLKIKCIPLSHRVTCTWDRQTVPTNNPRRDSHRLTMSRLQPAEPLNRDNAHVECWPSAQSTKPHNLWKLPVGWVWGKMSVIRDTYHSKQSLLLQHTHTYTGAAFLHPWIMHIHLPSCLSGWVHVRYHPPPRVSVCLFVCFLHTYAREVGGSTGLSW